MCKGREYTSMRNNKGDNVCRKGERNRTTKKKVVDEVKRETMHKYTDTYKWHVE